MTTCRGEGADRASTGGAPASAQELTELLPHLGGFLGSQRDLSPRFVEEDETGECHFESG